MRRPYLVINEATLLLKAGAVSLQQPISGPPPIKKPVGIKPVKQPKTAADQKRAMSERHTKGAHAGGGLKVRRSLKPDLVKDESNTVCKSCMKSFTRGAIHCPHCGDKVAKGKKVKLNAALNFVGAMNYSDRTGHSYDPWKSLTVEDLAKCDTKMKRRKKKRG